MTIISEPINESYFKDRLNQKDLELLYKSCQGDTIPFGSCDWIVLYNGNNGIKLISKYILSPVMIYTKSSTVSINSQVSDIYAIYNFNLSTQTSNGVVAFQSFNFSKEEIYILKKQDVSWQLGKEAGSQKSFLSFPLIADILALSKIKAVTGINCLKSTYEDYSFDNFKLAMKNNDFKNCFEEFLSEESEELDSYWYINSTQIPYKNGVSVLSFINKEGQMTSINDTKTDLAIRGFRPTIIIDKYKLDYELSKYNV